MTIPEPSGWWTVRHGGSCSEVAGSCNSTPSAAASVNDFAYSTASCPNRLAPRHALSVHRCRNSHASRGRRGGRQPKLSPQQQAEVLAMLNAGRSAADVARLFRVHRATISRVASSARL